MSTALANERQRAAALEREVTLLRASWSWRLSAPLRAFGRLLPAAFLSALGPARRQEPPGSVAPQANEPPKLWPRQGVDGPRVLFLSHDTHRAGAQLLLYRLLRWLRQNSKVSPVVLVRDGGELLADFEAVAPVIVWPPEERGEERLRLVDALRAEDVALVYSNTLANGEVLSHLEPLGCPVLTHVHELGHWIRTRASRTELEAVVASTDRYIAVSRAVSDCLQRELRVPLGAIARLPEFAPSAALSAAQRTARRQHVRDRLGIPGRSFVIGGCGTMDWRKGPELFVALARAIDRLSPDAHLHAVWVGGATAGPEWEALRYDAERCGLGTRIHFVGNQQDAAEFYAAFDVFALTSREDPFPLVMLEAAAMALPIVAFSDAGGSAEFVGDDAGVMVPYLDLGAMAEAVRRMIDDPVWRHGLGDRAADRFHAGFETEVVAPRILALMSELMGGEPLTAAKGPA